jgi:SAM-dependent methyltransferase
VRGEAFVVTGRSEALRDSPDGSTVALFQTAWRTYRKMVDNDYLFHRGAYGALHNFLVEEVNRPFRFLDLACGDAGASADALRGTRIAHYHGIDFSREALRIAETNLMRLGCPVHLEERDFVEAVGALNEATDVAWIGLSLHHLHRPEKQSFMARMRSLLSPGGHFLIYENTSPDGETREEWMKRWDAQRPRWTAYTVEEWDAVTGHVHAADFPETDSGWRSLGENAGFGKVRELFRSPTDLFRVYCFSA